ncbi:MAG TPA: AGE family epimerase/isomerase [Burkholderiaceae bacterium]|jgi:mannose/cellobiose epimerase-like protein (N-acyl-D-glucosamine 2-epimerase family)|nr:AGE family epimerase/isomerase [Burkholderiaceae bacterium]
MKPNFRSAETLRRHIADTLAFYDSRCVDPTGGFYHFFKDDGTVYDRSTRHLVSSARFIFNYAMAYRYFQRPEYLENVRHGLAFLRNVHRNPVSGAYAWEVRWQDGRKAVLNDTNHCYGLAFVMLAYAHALQAGVEEAGGYLAETFGLMERHFWDAQYGIYADEASADWSTLRPYRGQNANMHSCEALLAAFDATGHLTYLLRAETLARNITLRQAALAGGNIWEHYRADWTVDWDYNKSDKSNIFRPWGYQPGHMVEWAKLLLILERHSAHLEHSSDWQLPRAVTLFESAANEAWDHEHGGFHYGFGPQGGICDADKYFWVQAESLAAAALLADRTGDRIYWAWYDKIWGYAWTHFVDHRYGAWYRILSSDNRKISDEKSPAGKTDYHTMGACYEVLRVLKD